MKKLDLQATDVFRRNYQALQDGYRYLVNQGGSGSSKTYSICQLIIVLCSEKQGKRFSVIRKSLPDLKKSAMRDFFNVLKKNELYNDDYHNKTDNTYELLGNEIEFFGLEKGQKVRGARRDYLWLNEANEIDLDSFRQLKMRTSEAIFLDYNPSAEDHWIYDEVLTEKDAKKIRSTFRDNPFLPEKERKEIESFKEKDENYWRVYGLGRVGRAQNRIYPNWEHCNELPEEGERVFGIDFGYSNPTALVEVVFNDDDIYVDEKFYKTQMTDDELVEEVGKYCEPEDYIYADTEDPKAIEKLRNANFNVKEADKGKGSVMSGIKEIKKRNLYIKKGSTNLLDEIKSYSFKTKNDKVLDEPVKMNDHLLDSLRYAVYTHLNRGYIGWV